MAKPTTIRIPEDLLNEMDQFVRESKLDRSDYYRDILRKGFSLDKQERLLRKYTLKEISMMEVCKEMKWDPWHFLAQLKEKNLYLNVELEDWLDAAELPLQRISRPSKSTTYGTSGSGRCNGRLR